MAATNDDDVGADIADWSRRAEAQEEIEDEEAYASCGFIIRVLHGGLIRESRVQRACDLVGDRLVAANLPPIQRQHDRDPEARKPSFALQPPPPV